MEKTRALSPGGKRAASGRGSSMARSMSMKSIAEGQEQRAIAGSVPESVASTTDSNTLLRNASRSSFKATGRESRGSEGGTSVSGFDDLLPPDEGLPREGTLHPRSPTRISPSPMAPHTVSVDRYGGVPLRPPFFPINYIWSPFELRWVRTPPSFIAHEQQ